MHLLRVRVAPTLSLQLVLQALLQLPHGVPGVQPLDAARQCPARLEIYGMQFRTLGQDRFEGIQTHRRTAQVQNSANRKGVIA